MYKQIIIVRSDLKMSFGKMAAQVAHASTAFLLSDIQSNLHCSDQYCTKIEEQKLNEPSSDFIVTQEEWDSKVPQYLVSGLLYSPEFYQDWIQSGQSKIILSAKNKSKLLNAKILAEQIGLKQDKDFFLIYDKCKTVLHPEEPDGTILTCIGFRPLEGERVDKIGKHFLLYS